MCGPNMHQAKAREKDTKSLTGLSIQIQGNEKTNTDDTEKA